MISLLLTHPSKFAHNRPKLKPAQISDIFQKNIQPHDVYIDFVRGPGLLLPKGFPLVNTIMLETKYYLIDFRRNCT